MLQKNPENGVGQSADMAQNGWRVLLSPPYGRRLTVVSAGIALHAFNEIAVAPVMPAVLDSLGHPNYLPIVYALFFASVVAGGLSVAWLRRRIGARRALLAAIVVYVCGVACQSLAPSAEIVLLGRVLQGLGDGWIAGLSYSLIGEFFPPRLVPRVFSVEATLWASAALLGPLAGGLISDFVHWRLALAVSLPFILLLLAVLSAAPTQKADGADSSSRLALPPKIFRLDSTVGRGSWLLLLMTAAQSITTVYLAYCLHHLFALPSTLTGFVLVTMALSWSIVALPIANVTRTTTRRRLVRLAPLFQVCGMAIIACGLYLGVLPLVILGQMANGAAFGLLWAISNQAIMDDAAPEHRMETSALLPTIATGGYVIGGLIAGAFASGLGMVEAVAREQASVATPLSVPLLWLGASCLAALALAAAQGVRPKAIDA